MFILQNLAFAGKTIWKYPYMYWGISIMQYVFILVLFLICLDYYSNVYCSTKSLSVLPFRIASLWAMIM